MVDAFDRHHVIRRGITKESRLYGDIVHHQENIFAAPGIHTPDADVRPQSLAIFVQHVHTGHTTQHLVRILRPGPLNFLASDNVDRARDVLYRLLIRLASFMHVFHHHFGNLHWFGLRRLLRLDRRVPLICAGPCIGGLLAGNSRLYPLRQNKGIPATTKSYRQHPYSPSTHDPDTSRHD